MISLAPIDETAFILDKKCGNCFFDKDNGDPEDTPDGNDNVIDDEPEHEEKSYSEEEMKKAIKRRNNALRRAQQAEARLKELEDKLKSAPSNEEYESLKEKYEELQKKVEAFIKKDDKGKSDGEGDESKKEELKKRLKLEKEVLENNLKELSDKLKSYEEKEAEYKKAISKYRVKGLEADLKSAALKYKAYNPTQIMKLLKDDFTYDEKDDEWYYNRYNKRTGELVELMTVDEYVKAFLKDPENENLLSTSIQPGTGSRHASSPKDKLPAGEVTKEMLAWATSQGLSIDPKVKEDREWLTRIYNKFMRSHESEGSGS